MIYNGCELHFYSKNSRQTDGQASISHYKEIHNVILPLPQCWCRVYKPSSGVTHQNWAFKPKNHIISTYMVYWINSLLLTEYLHIEPVEDDQAQVILHRWRDFLLKPQPSLCTKKWCYYKQTSSIRGLRGTWFSRYQNYRN